MYFLKTIIFLANNKVFYTFKAEHIIILDQKQAIYKIYIFLLKFIAITKNFF